MSVPRDFPADVDQIAKRVVWHLRMVPRHHTAPDLCNALHITGRELQHAVQWARTRGDKDLSRIGSGDAGYFWADDIEAAKSTIEHLYHRIGAIRESAQGMVRAYGPGAMQEELDLTT